MKFIKRTCIALISCVICAFSFINKTVEQNKSLVLNAKRPIVTIWVHGTKLTPTIVLKRFFYRIPGMHKASAYDTQYHKRSIVDLLCKTDANNYQFENFYIFGWNGKLCFNQRKHAAQELYDNIQEIIKEHTNILGVPPFIRIITHSHGGNVALNLAKIQKKKNPIIIDELILLACPVQHKTKKLIQNDCFKKVYAFYSAGDMFQVIDPQGWYKKGKSNKTFSERRFEHHEKLRQACIKLNGRPLMHIDFIWTSFIQHLPSLCNAIDDFYKTITPEQIHYKKQLDIRTKSDPVVIHKKLL